MNEEQLDVLKEALYVLESASVDFIEAKQYIEDIETQVDEALHELHELLGELEDE